VESLTDILYPWSLVNLV